MKRANILLLLVIASILFLLLTPFYGMERISPQDIFASHSTQTQIFWKIRVPRVLTAFVAGAALALSGMVFQAIFRNPLATPFTLGVSSGAALGASLYVKIGLAFSLVGIPGDTLFSFGGALLSILLVYGLARSTSGFSSSTMLLAGVAVSFSFSSVILLLQYCSDFSESFRIVRWLMGGLEVVGYRCFFTMMPFVVIGTTIVLGLTYELNLMSTGEDIAMSKGVPVSPMRNVLFFATSLMIGGVVAQAGPIGFVGMMCPHICRLLIGSNHNYLAPATLLLGGTFLGMCDTIARIIIAPAEIPVGIITAFLGGPFFLWILLTTCHRRSLV